MAALDHRLLFGLALGVHRFRTSARSRRTARVLELGFRAGLLSIPLARRHDLDALSSALDRLRTRTPADSLRTRPAVADIAERR